MTKEQIELWDIGEQYDVEDEVIAHPLLASMSALCAP